jgi:hypothetical protein
MRRVAAIVLFVLIACKGNAPPSTQTQSTTNSSSTTASAANTPITSTESAVAPEVNPPGDIPDTQAFVRYSSPSGGYSLEVPEGWARTESGPSVTFVSKLDGVSVTITPATAAPTATTAQQQEAKRIQQSGRAVQITSASEIQLPAGHAVVIKYLSNSDPNPVTNKQVRLDNETYLYFKNGKEAALTLWAPHGADNVDQWQRMAKSFRWQ